MRFLSFPVSFKGRLVQYTGRLMRADDSKTAVRVYDYADTQAPVLRATHARRLRTYKSLGFSARANQRHRLRPEVTVRPQLSFIGLGSSTTGRSALDTDELFADAFGRT